MMGSKLTVRAYNVAFGDAILVSVPDGGSVRHILIDVGNLVAGDGGPDTMFVDVVNDIAARTNGVVDLYVMSHEHLDHVQGLRYAAQHGASPLTAKRVWMTSSSQTHPDYYASHPESKKRKLAAEAVFAQLQSSTPSMRGVGAVLQNNDRLAAGGGSTAECVEHIRTQLAPEAAVRYVHRDSSLGRSLFTDRSTRLEVLGPEEDTSIYYGRFRPMALGRTVAPATTPNGRDPAPAATLRPPLVPPAGVDAGAFFDLLASRAAGPSENVRLIDAAANNTSVVLSLRWKDWHLLFPGDTEVRGWKEMQKRGLLGPVHFLKVAHHGSDTGHPPSDILDTLLPVTPTDTRPRSAIVSTCVQHSYPSVPDDTTIDAIKARVETFERTDTKALGDFVEVEFDEHA